MKRLLILSTTFFLVLGSTNLYSQKRDSRDLLPEGSFPQGMEGPAVDRLGNLYAVNYQKKGTIGKVSFAGKVSLFVTLPEGSTGNGIRFDRKGNMFVADYTAHNILKINRKTKEIEVFAHEPAMNQPNDLTISRKTDIIYASDPNWKDSTGNLWMIKPDGKVVNLERNIGTTNGIEVSPNGKYLYVNESIQRKIWRYDIAKDGSISNKTLFYSFEDFGMDGMRCDSYGSLFVTRHGKGTVVKLSPKGKLVKEYILKGKLATNLTFSEDESMIYVTVADRGCFETIYLGENPTFSSSHTTK
jgi:sugar lactone lactonase YvrE